MFEKNDKRRLYWLLENLLSGKIDDRTFCDEFSCCYDLEIDYQTLSESEQKAFSELAAVASRFSEFAEDHELDVRAFSTRKELRQKVKEVQVNLMAS